MSEIRGRRSEIGNQNLEFENQMANNVGADASVCPKNNNKTVGAGFHARPTDKKINIKCRGTGYRAQKGYGPETNYAYNSGITLIALIITIIVLIILAGVTLNVTIGENGIITKSKQAVDKYQEAAKQEQINLQKVELDMVMGAESEGYNIKTKVNTPELLTGMTPIKFEEAKSASKPGTTAETTTEDENWYNYENKQWANAKTEDGSMWVWIPRYAYKITYTDETDKSQGGIIDVKFLIGTSDSYYDENGDIQTAQRQTEKDQTIDTTKDYTVHPAFTNETRIDYANGGWDKELTGIWVAKFEAGYASGGNDATVKASSVNYSQTTVWANKIERGIDPETGEAYTEDGIVTARNWLDGVYGSTVTAIKYPTFQGTTYSMNYINQNDSFNICKVLTESGNIYGLNSSNADSHLMKNSEWGAVAYLSESKYGLNGTDIAVNSKNKNSGSSSKTKEEGNDFASVYAVTGYNSNGNEWNNYIGSNKSASTTGNMYGIYDLCGGYTEMTAGYLAIEGWSLNDGKSMAYNYDENTKTYTTLRTISTKYATVYPHNEEGDNYSVNTRIYGDAIRETSTAGTGYTGWYDGQSNYMVANAPLSCYGYSMWANVGSLFVFMRTTGPGHTSAGFRAVLVRQ